MRPPRCRVRSPARGPGRGRDWSAFLAEQRAADPPGRPPLRAGRRTRSRTASSSSASSLRATACGGSASSARVPAPLRSRRGSGPSSAASASTGAATATGASGSPARSPASRSSTRRSSAASTCGACPRTRRSTRVRALWPALTREQLADAVARVAGAVDGRSWWLLLVRRPRLQSISRPGRREPTRPRAKRGWSTRGRSRARCRGPRAARRAPRRPSDLLPARARLLVRLRYEQELPLEEVARLTGLSGAAQVERQVRAGPRRAPGRDGRARIPAGVSVKEKREP